MKKGNKEAREKPRQFSWRGQTEVSYQAAHPHYTEDEEDGNRVGVQESLDGHLIRDVGRGTTTSKVKDIVTP